MEPITNIFNPVTYSLAECKFLITHLGEPPALAMRECPPLQPISYPSPDGKRTLRSALAPSGIIPDAVQPALERIYELSELQRHTGEAWCGVEACKKALRTYVEQSEKWARDKQRGAPRFPSMYGFDSKHRAHRGAPGSDSGIVSTYFDKTGTRLPFAIYLFGDGDAAWTPEWAKSTPAGTDAPDPTTGLVNNAEARRFECFCGHTEHYKEDSRASYNAARARLARHLLKATDEVERHRELHSLEFSS